VILAVSETEDDEQDDDDEVECDDKGWLYSAFCWSDWW
jgi:hypothetical protein